MANRKTAADRAFDRKVREACDAKDWDTIKTVFEQYGAYLELVDAKPEQTSSTTQRVRQHASASDDA